MVILEFYFQFIFYTVVLPHNVADDVSVKQHDVHVLSISYIKTSNHLIFCVLRLKKVICGLDSVTFRCLLIYIWDEILSLL